MCACVRVCEWYDMVHNVFCICHFALVKGREREQEREKSLRELKTHQRRKIAIECLSEYGNSFCCLLIRNVFFLLLDKICSDLRGRQRKEILWLAVFLFYFLLLVCFFFSSSYEKLIKYQLKPYHFNQQTNLTIVEIFFGDHIGNGA